MDMHGGGGSHSCVQNRFSYNNWKKKETYLRAQGCNSPEPIIVVIVIVVGWVVTLMLVVMWPCGCHCVVFSCAYGVACWNTHNNEQRR